MALVKDLNRVSSGAETVSDLLSGHTSIQTVGPRGKYAIGINSNLVTTTFVAYGAQSGQIIAPDGTYAQCFSTTAGQNGVDATRVPYTNGNMIPGERVIVDLTVAGASTTQMRFFTE